MVAVSLGTPPRKIQNGRIINEPFKTLCLCMLLPFSLLPTKNFLSTFTFFFLYDFITVSTEPVLTK
jgi:hypothetical protein